MSYTKEKLMKYASMSLVEYKKTMLYPLMKIRSILAEEYLNALHEEDIKYGKLWIPKSIEWQALNDTDIIKQILWDLISDFNMKLIQQIAGVEEMKKNWQEEAIDNISEEGKKNIVNARKAG